MIPTQVSSEDENAAGKNPRLEQVECSLRQQGRSAPAAAEKKAAAMGFTATAYTVLATIMPS